MLIIATAVDWINSTNICSISFTIDEHRQSPIKMLSNIQMNLNETHILSWIFGSGFETRSQTENVCLYQINNIKFP